MFFLKGKKINIFVKIFAINEGINVVFQFDKLMVL